MIELLNEYYTNQQCKDFSIVPSADTAQLLRNQQMLYKMVGNKLIVLVKVNDADEPFVNIDTDKKFLFYMDLGNPVFTTFTNLDLDILSDKRYYFTNLNQNEVDPSLYLTGKIDNYSNASPYKPGDFVDDSTGDIFECIQTSAGGHNTADGSFWHLRGQQEYASAKDMLLYVTRINNYSTSVPSTSFTIRVFGLNTATNVYDSEIEIEKNSFTADEPTNNVQANLSGLRAGRYKLQINSDEFDVFVDDEAVYNNVFGVIEIFGHLTGTNHFALLDNSGKVKDQVVSGISQWLNYKVKFANRLAYWRYISIRNGVNDIVDNIGSYNFIQIPMPPPPLPPSEMFLSNIPIPINETPRIFNLDLAAPVSNEPPAAPNPDPGITGMLTRTNGDYYCNIYLNY